MIIKFFESILVDQFVGKFGEIIVKKFLERNFCAKIELDWEISTQIERYRNDIVNANKNVSIPYLGKVREERYLVPINELKYTKDDWSIFLEEVGLI